MAEETQTSGTDLEEISTEDELATDTNKWSDKEHKKLQHMTEFHREYQRVFGNRVSLRTIIRKRISHMNPPIPSSVCKEEMQDAESNEVIVEFITDSKGNRVKKLKPYLSNLNLIRLMFNMYLVMMNYPLFQKKDLTKNKRSQ